MEDTSKQGHAGVWKYFGFYTVDGQSNTKDETVL